MAGASLGNGTELAGKDKTKTQDLDGMEFLQGLGGKERMHVRLGLRQAVVSRSGA